MAMRTSRADISCWLAEGKRRGASHVIIASDTFSYEDYPVYVMPDSGGPQVELDWLKGASYTNVRECYDLSLDIDAQLSEPRAWHVDLPAPPATEGAR